MSGYGTRPTRGLLDTETNRQALVDALMGVPRRVGNAFTGMAQHGLLANERFMQGEGADQPFLPSMDSGGRVGALASFLSSNMAMGGPAGSLGAGPSMARKAAALPMDEASRMRRARAGGYTIDAYHGTPATNIEAFDTPISWVSKKPKLASDYATVKAARDWESETLGTVYPLKVSAKKSFSVPIADANEKLTYPEFFQKVGFEFTPDKYVSVVDDWNVPQRFKAWQIINTPEFAEALRQRGFDSVAMKEGGAPTIGILNPENIRSRFAAFDPAKRNSADLLAGYANPSPAFLYGEPQE